MIKGIVKLKMVLGIDQGRCQGGESISYRGSVGEKLSKRHQAEDRHCAHKTWIKKMDLKEDKLFSVEINTAWTKSHQLLLQSM